MFHLEKISPDHMIRRCPRLAYTRSPCVNNFSIRNQRMLTL